MTNRRSFFKSLAVLGASFTILPSALTYARSWKPSVTWAGRLWVPNPEWRTAQFEMYFIDHPALCNLQNDSPPWKGLPTRGRFDEKSGRYYVVPSYIPA